MAYATPDDYQKYGDNIIPVTDLEKSLERASDQIDSLTYNRIVAKTFERLTNFQQANITKAVCQQADFVYKYGEYLDMPIDSYSAGSISMGFTAVEGGGGIKTSESVVNLLSATGLTSRRL